VQHASMEIFQAVLIPLSRRGYGKGMSAWINGGLRKGFLAPQIKRNTTLATNIGKKNLDNSIKERERENEKEKVNQRRRKS